MNISSVHNDSIFLHQNRIFYDRQTGEVVQLPKEEAQPIIDRAQNELNMSDKIIKGDLLRFSDSNKIKRPTATILSFSGHALKIIDF